MSSGLAHNSQFNAEWCVSRQRDSAADAVTVGQLKATMVAAQRDFVAQIVPKVRDAAARGQL
jgi:hypothetical protein